MTSLGLPKSRELFCQIMSLLDIMITCSAYSWECAKHNVNVLGVLSERVSERRSRKPDTDIGLHINVIGRIY